MLTFWIAASLMIGVALMMVLPSLLGRSGRTPGERRSVNVDIFQDRLAVLQAEGASNGMQEQEREDARIALERQLLVDLDDDSGALASRPPGGHRFSIALAVVLPLLALGMYFHFGDPSSLLQPDVVTTSDAGSNGRALAAVAGGKGIPHSVEDMVSGLETRLKAQPQDADGWLMLGRSYAAMNRLLEARDALQAANSQRPDHPFTLVAFAEVQAGLQGNRLAGEPLKLVQRALEIDPAFPRALWLAGVASYRMGDGERARQHWRRLLSLNGLDAGSRQRVQQAIAQATPESEPASGGPAQTTAAATGAAVSVRVELAPELASRAAPEDVVFVFARATEGPRIPLAVQRLRVAELPRTLVLDDSMAMAPQMRLSGFRQVIVGARVSRSGSATPGPGDLTGASEPVAVGAGGTVAVRIDRIQG